MASTAYLLVFIVLATLATFLTRALPFLLFARHAQSDWLQFLGRVLPPVLMVLLLVYALKTPLVSGTGLPQSALALGLVVLLHRLFGNALVSILGGTLGYMLLVQQWLPL